ncbi:50S ribosomal protein L1 [bacterium]|jgi:large subunit ribosomal protein L1|nr:50S ribosomal protein L1 [bacterium]MBT4250910.1 50S ribosomal protein L1 [bacterium]MBT4597902.1 50S ribosomal protein L1 [bacterium]MBT6753907.1 50S ribosomal protein L1 [bacterium]MBT7037336.1 50S ribosomal protein L1 [bacterium]
MRRGKRYKSVVEGYDQKAEYTIEEALEILEKFSAPKFDESVEAHVRLNINPTKSDQQVRATVDLPHGTGKTKRIAAFTETQEKEAKAAGADIIAGTELIEKIVAGGEIDFDIAVTTPEMMPKLAKAARVLGPRGLMPNPKTQTVGPKIDVLIAGLKGGRASFKNDNGANIHQVIGKRSFKKDQLKENFEVFIKEVQQNKPATLKGRLLKSVSITSTMNPSIQVKIA